MGDISTVVGFLKKNKYNMNFTKRRMDLLVPRTKTWYTVNVRRTKKLGIARTIVFILKVLVTENLQYLNP